jgi:hypothetical protein
MESRFLGVCVQRVPVAMAAIPTTQRPMTQGTLRDQALDWPSATPEASSVCVRAD